MREDTLTASTLTSSQDWQTIHLMQLIPPTYLLQPTPNKINSINILPLVPLSIASILGCLTLKMRNEKANPKLKISVIIIYSKTKIKSITWIE